MNRWIAAGAMALTLMAAEARAETFKWAYQGDVQSLDPQGLNETFTLGFLGNVYEGLTAYDAKLKLQPSLATSWDNTDKTHWRFHLRKGVTFHNGDKFTADDVIFTWKRGKTPGSDMKGYSAKISDIKKVDDYTIDVTTPTPNPILPRDLTLFFIMDKEWAETNNATEATSPKDANGGSSFAASHENGTGPFVVVSRQPDVKTVFKNYDGYWDKDMKSNVTEVVFTPISEDATRTAALLSGNLDVVYPVPMQDWPRLDGAQGVKALHAPDVRTIFLGMDQFRDELLYSSVKGKNPLKDQKVRSAMAHAIDLEAINKKIMRGAANPTGLLVGPQVNGYDEALGKPYAYDPKHVEEALGRSGLSRRLRARHGLPEQSLRQRRADLPGRSPAISPASASRSSSTPSRSRNISPRSPRRAATTPRSTCSAGPRRRSTPTTRCSTSCIPSTRIPAPASSTTAIIPARRSTS